MVLAVLRLRNFTLLWLAGVLSSVGDWVLFIALPFYVYELTGSALATGAMLMVYNIPRVLISSVAGVFVDRWDRRWTMVIADVARAALLLLLLMLQSVESLWVVYLVIFLQSTVGQFFFPAKNALIPRLVGEPQLVAANSLDEVSGGLARLIGPSIGGILLALLGLASAVLVNVATFVASAALIALVALPSETIRGGTRSHHRSAVAIWMGIGQEWSEGIGWVRHQRVVTVVFFAAGLVMVSYGAITVLLVLFVRDVLTGGAVVYGWLATAQGVGAVLGGAVIGLADRVMPPARLLSLSLGVAGLAFFGTFNTGILPLVLVFIALAGMAVTVMGISGRTLLQSSVTDQYRGRIFGAYQMSNSLLILVGMGLASVLAGPLGVVNTLSIASGLYVLGGVVAHSMQPRSRVISDLKPEAMVQE